MKNNRLISILLFLFLMISGCASYLHERDLKEWNKNLILKKQPPLCEINPTLFSIFGENKEAVFSFDNLLKQNSDMHRLSLVEVSVLWALLQFKVRPDLVNPKSRLQIFHVKNNSPHYLDFSSDEEETTSFLFGLDAFLKENNSRYNLLSISKLLTSLEKEQIPIGEGFSDFVQANKSKLRSDPILYKNYFKAGLEIRKGESLPNLNFKKIISDFYTVKKSDRYKRNHLLFTESRNGSVYRCNFDINLYRKGIYLISNDPDPKSWTVGISKANGDHIFMVAGNSIKEIKPLKDTFFFKTR